jgi:hypothetical protein
MHAGFFKMEYKSRNHSVPAYHPENGQYDDSANDGYGEAVEIKARHIPSHPKHRRQPAADHRPNNSQDTGQDKAAAIPSRHNKFGYNTGNKTKNYPRENAHFFLSPA